MSPPTWFEATVLGEHCDPETHCIQCDPSGSCDSCNTVEGRWMEAVNEYASTCDDCGDLTHHELMVMDPVTQLGYCARCIPGLPPEIKERLEKGREG